MDITLFSQTWVNHTVLAHVSLSYNRNAQLSFRGIISHPDLCSVWRVKVSELLLFPVHAYMLQHMVHSLAAKVAQMEPRCQCFPSGLRQHGALIWPPPPPCLSFNLLVIKDILDCFFFFQTKDGTSPLIQSDSASWQILSSYLVFLHFLHLDVLQLPTSAGKHNIAKACVGKWRFHNKLPLTPTRILTMLACFWKH